MSRCHRYLVEVTTSGSQIFEAPDEDTARQEAESWGYDYIAGDTESVEITDLGELDPEEDAVCIEDYGLEELEAEAV